MQLARSSATPRLPIGRRMTTALQNERRLLSLGSLGHCEEDRQAGRHGPLTYARRLAPPAPGLDTAAAPSHSQDEGSEGRAHPHVRPP